MSSCPSFTPHAVEMPGGGRIKKKTIPSRSEIVYVKSAFSDKVPLHRASAAVHAPNEKFHLPNFFKGIATSIHFLAEMAGQPIDLPIAARRGLTSSEFHDEGAP